MRPTGTGIAAAAVLAPLLLVPVLFAATTPPAGATSCTVAAGGAGSAGSPARLALTADQLANAHAVVAAAKTAGLGQAGAAIGLMTGMQESGLRNLANPVVPETLALPHQGVGSNYDSVGLFQQRPSQGWGTPAQLLDPGYAAAAFFTQLAAVGGWQSMPAEQAAQAVQASADSSLYTRWRTFGENTAAALYGSSVGTLVCTRSTAAQHGAVLPGGWANPLPGAVVTQPFGVQNGRDAGGHPGVDLATAAGTPMLAVHAGTIVFAGPASGYGDHYVCVDIGGGLVTCYGHGQAQLVNVGQQVTAGQPLALEGCEGSCTGPHLHLEVRTGMWGPVQDPVAFLAAHGAHLG